MARKFIIPTIMGLALNFGSNAYAGNKPFPVYQETKTKIAQVEKQAEQNRVENRIELKNKLDTMVKEYETRLEIPIRYFNKSIEDGRLDINEQKEIYSEFKKTEDYRGNVNKFAIENNFSEIRYTEDIARIPYEESYLKTPEIERNLMKLIKENIRGVDFKKPSLEKQLESEGLNVKVERKATFLEILSVLGIVSLVAFRLYCGEPLDPHYYKKNLEFV